MVYYTILMHLFYRPLPDVLIVVNLYCLMEIDEFFISSFVDYNSVSATLNKNGHSCHFIFFGATASSGPGSPHS